VFSERGQTFGEYSLTILLGTSFGLASSAMVWEVLKVVGAQAML